MRFQSAVQLLSLFPQTLRDEFRALPRGTTIEDVR
jgi:hypothetical protein